MIAPNGSCTSTITINSPNITEVSHGYIDLKVCIDNGAECSASRIKTAITLDPSAPTNSQTDTACTGVNGACKVRVSSSTMKGDLKVINNATIASACDMKTTGLARGNCICATEALAAGYDGEWHAWLSDSDVDALDNIQYSAEHTYILLDGNDTLLAGPAQLLSGGLESPIDDSGTPVWTGTLHLGIKATARCTDWVDTAASTRGIVGFSSNDGVSWTDLGGGGALCSREYPIYCFQG